MTFLYLIHRLSIHAWIARKPRQLLLSTPQGRKDLLQRLERNDGTLAAFCESVPWNRYTHAVLSLFPSLVRQSTATALVLQAPPRDPPSRNVQPAPDDESNRGEGRDAISVLANSAFHHPQCILTIYLTLSQYSLNLLD